MKDINKINDFINIVLTQVCRSFSQNCDFKHELGDVYPYIKYAQLNSNKQEICDNSYDSLGELYETFLPINIRKDYGQFYTRDHDVINTMLDNLNLLSGKILEPSCGSGIFIISILKKMVISLKQKELNEEQIINYICENVYANDIDPNAIKIAELNVLWFLMPLIVKAKIDNPKFIMKKLHFTNYDFTQKNIFSEKFSVIVGNPPFVTMYGKRSRNMTEEKRVYYNTFDFVQHKNGNNKFNISMFFVENALKILKNKGVLSFILDITFYETAFKDLRKYIVENYFIDSMIVGLNEFTNVASGQLILNIVNKQCYNPNIRLIEFETKKENQVNQKIWDNSKNNYKFFQPLTPIEKEIIDKLNKFPRLEEVFPGKALRTCCALTGRTEDFIVEPNKPSPHYIFPYIEGSKGLSSKFCIPEIKRYIKYDYDLQIKISDEFKIELEKKGVKNKKRVTLGDKNAYLSNKIFIRQSATEIIATYCSEPYAANNSIYILSIKDNRTGSEKLLKYTCGILNSNLISFYSRVCQIIRMAKGKTPQIKLSDLKNIRISINDDYFDLIIDIVDALLENNNNANLFSHLNKIVYNIYGITDDEIKYIETYLKSSKES